MPIYENTEHFFPEIDLSFWKTTDRAWVAERAARWKEIEPSLKYIKPSKGVTICKHYFLKGRLPDWEALRDWKQKGSHLDLFLFLWLHPSEDKEYLIQLRDLYIKSMVITKSDIRFSHFLDATIDRCSFYYNDEAVQNGEIGQFIITGKNEFYFDVLMRNIEYITDGVETLQITDYLRQKLESIKVELKVPKGRGLFELKMMGKWLCIKKMRPINEDFLLQYDDPLEWWYRGCEQNEDYFVSIGDQAEKVRNGFRKALYRIHHFDSVAEGDTCRSRFVEKISGILDERPFIGEITEMWLKVKSGDIHFDDAYNEWPQLD